MHTFTDTENRQWEIAINVTAIKRVKGTLELDLLKAVEGDLFVRLANDPCLLCDLLFVLCQEQAKEQGVTDEQFGAALGGDALDAATTALLEELVDFFPKGKRGALKKILDKVKQLEARATEFIHEKVDSGVLDGVADRVLKDADASLTASLESLASTRDR